MHKFKGTPGPWIKEVRHTKNGRRIIVAVIPKKDGDRIYETVLQTGNIDPDDDCGVETCCCVEEHANARLIAAAPELLEAVIALRAFIDDIIPSCAAGDTQLHYLKAGSDRILEKVLGKETIS